jgi:phytanoyl-CoA hydroxylase
MEHQLEEDQTAHYRREGSLVVHEVLGADDLVEIDEVISEVVTAAVASGEAKKYVEVEPGDTGPNPALRRILQPYERHAGFRSIAQDPRVVDRVESLIGPNLELHHSKLNWKPAQVGSPVAWHQDLSYYPHSNDSVLAVLIYLDSATEANGCLQVLPRQHREYLDHQAPNGEFAGRLPDEVTADCEPELLAAPAGSAIFLHGLTPHASLPNHSTTDRRTLIFAYRAGDAYPLFYGSRTAHDEQGCRSIRGIRARNARFAGPSPIVPRINTTNSLYDIQTA